eukprot:6464950-Amphidinium_carterae.1
MSAGDNGAGPRGKVPYKMPPAQETTLKAAFKGQVHHGKVEHCAVPGSMQAAASRGVAWTEQHAQR